MKTQSTDKYLWIADKNGFAVVIAPSGLRIELGAKSNPQAQSAKEAIVEACNEHAALVAVAEAAKLIQVEKCQQGNVNGENSNRAESKLQSALANLAAVRNQ